MAQASNGIRVVMATLIGAVAIYVMVNGDTKQHHQSFSLTPEPLPAGGVFRSAADGNEIIFRQASDGLLGEIRQQGFPIALLFRDKNGKIIAEEVDKLPAPAK